MALIVVNSGLIIAYFNEFRKRKTVAWLRFSYSSYSFQILSFKKSFNVGNSPDDVQTLYRFN